MSFFPIWPQRMLNFFNLIGTDFTDLADHCCPVCEAPKTDFSIIDDTNETWRRW